MTKPASLQLNETEWQIISSILQQHLPGYEVWAFGSRVKGKAKPYSDLDLAIISNTPLSLSQLATVAEAFSESDLPWKVDLIDWSTTSEQFRQIIRQQKQILQHSQSASR